MPWWPTHVHPHHTIALLHGQGHVSTPQMRALANIAQAPHRRTQVEFAITSNGAIMKSTGLTSKPTGSAAHMTSGEQSAKLAWRRTRMGLDVGRADS
jgi:hypothetical protein